MIKSRYLAAGCAVMLGLTACNTDKLTELNVNPNSPADVPAAPLFTQATRSAVSRWLGSGYALVGAELVAQHLSQVQYPDQDRYTRLGAADTRTYFDNPYVNELEDYQKVIQKGLSASAPGTYGPALVMRTWVFSYITNTFGDIPYFGALAGDSAGGSIAPKYDAQKDIYADMFKQLDKASKDLATGGANGSLSSADPIYAGASDKWQRFSNSLRARLALNVANVDAATTDAQLRAALAAPGGLMKSNADNAIFYWPGNGIYNNPWSDNFKTRDDHRISKTLVDIMAATSDPRIPLFAQPTAADPTKYAGLQNGLTHANAGAFFNTTSRAGAFLYPGATAYGNYGGAGAKAPSILMTYAEVQFILAEAAERGIAGLTPAQAKGYYEAGIRASMEQWSTISGSAGSAVVTDAQITAFLANPAVAYKGGVEGLKQIATQKWIHLFTDGGTAWTEWRRTCSPATVKPGPSASQATVPRRFMYSPTEYSVNKTELDAAVAAQGADNFNSRMYWDRSPTAAPTYVAGCGTR